MNGNADHTNNEGSASTSEKIVILDAGAQYGKVILNLERVSYVSNRHLCTMSITCVLADDKMANISLDVRTFIAQNIVSTPHLTTLSSP